MSLFETHATTHVRTLVDAIEARLPSRVKLFQKLSNEYADVPLHNMTIGNVMGGMRGLPCMLWEISGTSGAGISYHGKSLRELQDALPKWPGSEQVSPEAMLWYLYSGSVPTQDELEHFAADLASRGEIPAEVEDFCDSLSSDISSTAQLIMSLSIWANHSKFTAALMSGVPRNQLWRHALEDALDSHAGTPLLTARIHANKYRNGRGRDTPLNSQGDIAENFAIRMGRGAHDADFKELVRMYWALHMDHGANVSAHTMRLSSSAWTDPYLTLASGLISGTGILHAGAIMQALRYNQAMAATLGLEPSAEAVEAYVCRTLAKGHVVPGYGHALLRSADPRLEPITRFINSRPAPAAASSEHGQMLRLIARNSTIVPDVLRRHVPKMKSTAPNVDSLSGCLMYAYGLDVDFILLVMGCSRGMGFMAQYVWDRALGLPIERPLSITMDQIMSKL
ncbi:citrate synthase [Laetiporus sulphureus 93-53]|uniref:Citrate synthase n=1 Tax=Laetiporus sulphureus 93-53 TaxID=1314785 RepID=A0A165FNL0_9APHY|nr:citrate synthase [Laetiporus sulphureus 93-53]KZT09239.1 citrate synthase [Laetiporus sulphureus 93-53]